MQRPTQRLSSAQRTGSFARLSLSTALLCGFVFVLTLIIHSFRITMAPDLLVDEAVYYNVGRNVATGSGLTESGKIFLWHPPLYMMLEALYLRMFGLIGADPIAGSYHVRLINATASAFTAGLLFLIGNRLRGVVTGSVIALIFCLDPYVQRINRRNMMETVAQLFLVLGIYLYLRRLHTRNERARDVLLPGLAFGVALLTKEVLVFGPIILLLFAYFFRRDQIRRVIAVAAVSLMIYSIWPISLFLSGHGPAYIAMKAHQARRFLGPLLGGRQPSAEGPRVGAGKISAWDSLLINLAHYTFTYLLILAAVGAMLFLFTRRRTPGDRLIATWAATAYGFMGVGLLFGRISDHFFYYLLVPAVVVVGRCVASLLQQFAAFWSHRTFWRNTTQPTGRSFNYSHAMALVVLPVVLVGLVWNSAVYMRLFVFGQDNSTASLYSYIHKTIPAGTTLVVGNDIANYVLPNYRIRFYRDKESVQQEKVRYFILSTKERWGGYAGVTPEFYDWVASNSTVRFEQYGNTFWTLRLFEMRPDEVNN